MTTKQANAQKLKNSLNDIPVQIEAQLTMVAMQRAIDAYNNKTITSKEFFKDSQRDSMNKNIRNKAYANDQYFTCDFNGAEWLTNAYIAEPDTTEPRNTKTCYPRTNNGNKPLLGKIVDITTHTLTDLKMARTVTDTTVKLNFSTKDNTIQSKYFDYFINRYPDAIFKTSGKFKYEAISIYSNNKLVGIVMPSKD